MSQPNLIVLIGPDGCGKTTIANELEGVIGEIVVHRAANFECIPTISQLKHYVKSCLSGDPTGFVRNTDEYKGYHSGMQQNPNSIVKSTLLFFWYFIDYMLGHIELGRARKCGRTFVFARYYYDYYFQISNKNLHHRFLHVFEFFIPKPKYVFNLYRDAAVIYAAKPELSIAEIKRQQGIIQNLADERDQFFTIDCDGGVENVVKQIKEIMYGC